MLISTSTTPVPTASLLYEADLSQKDPSMSDAQVMTAIQNKIELRIKAYGITDSKIKVQGVNQVLVTIPGGTNIDQLIDLIGKTAFLEFKEEQFDASGNVVRDADGNTVWVPATALGSDGITPEALTGSYLKPNAYITTDSRGQPQVAFEWNTEGAKLNKGVIAGLKIDQAKILADQLNSGSLECPLKLISSTK